MMNKIELEVIETYLDSPFGTPQSIDALDRVIEMIDQRKSQWASKEK